MTSQPVQNSAEVRLDTWRDRNFLTVPQLCSDVFDDQVDQRTIRRAIDEGTIPAVKLGAKTLVPVAKLRALIEPPATSAPLPSPGIAPGAVVAAMELIRAGLAALGSLTESTTDGESATVTRLPGVDRAG